MLRKKNMRELVAVVEKVHNGRENADEIRKEQSKNQILTGLLLPATAGKEEPRMPLRSLDAVEEDKKLRGNKERPLLGKNQCAYCKKQGHWAADCPKFPK